MEETTKPLWVKTNVPSLYRHRDSGRYYARVYVGSKEIWRALKTKLKAVAVNRLQEHQKTAREQRAARAVISRDRFTFGDALGIYQANLSRNTEIKEGTRQFRQAGIKIVLKTWPEIVPLSVRKITAPMVKDWALKVRHETKPFVPYGAKTASRNSTGASPTTFNCALDAIRHVLDIAVDHGHLFLNPARDKSVKRATPKAKRIILPSREQIQAIFEAIDNLRYGECKAAGEMARFLAYTGARKTEANNVLWQDVNFTTGRITLRVTKNGEIRDVPMIPECRKLLERLRADRAGEEPTKPVLRIRECRGFLENACRKINVPRIGHHDLRHAFATTAIEAGIDIPTVAKIMGHRDGGALAMKVYGHLRDEHAQAAMQKVSFGKS